MAGKAAEQGIAAQVARIADGLSRLVSEHIALLRLELAEDARAVGISIGTIAALAPFVLVGYALLCASLAWAVSPWVGVAGGLAIVGGVNVAGGVGGILVAVNKLRTRRMLGTSRRELGQSTRVFSNQNGADPGQQLMPGAALERRTDGR
ncbi:MAG TPA: phage holin family protein [Myxococcaceae bacterium]|nr:phage holin family protein [Myxococcaceae bacterium]